MSTVQAQLLIATKPEQRTKKDGTACLYAKAREGDDRATIWHLFAFTKIARVEIGRLRPGDAVAVMGELKLRLEDGAVVAAISVAACLPALRLPTPKPKAAKKKGTLMASQAGVAAAQSAWLCPKTGGRAHDRGKRLRTAQPDRDPANTFVV